ncbi:sterol desaturase family protein [Flavobacterium silvaticum]|uniref:Sterol desaturase family protein n=1 Tax=Flavobacterium silvaticum TaxID=1852020 RepID=A0A972JJJ7_9FLAO|nr:sterol desaturase family protein [Flavobacterium silvaticum]NMH29443.1 sterol desaturase family protein [Flavobacterium silvaticum]
MDSIIAYFSTIPSLHRALILAGGITVFWLTENAFPLFKMDYKKWQHAGINIFFTFTTIVVNFLLAFVLLLTAHWVAENDFGLLNWISSSYPWIYTILGLLLLDLIGAWLAHFVQHKVPVLWRFHLIHHSDTWIDTTSANRHHPGESVIRFLFTVLAVLVSGSPMWLVFLYQSLSVVFSQFTHANLRLPVGLDRWISYVFVSPDMHKVHHHYQLPYTDSNYGNIFSIWDRLFGTFEKRDRADIVYGIDTHHHPSEHNNLKKLIALPFTKLRKPNQHQ